MHILNNLKNYLYDQNYIINIYDNYVYLFNYIELIRLMDTSIKIKFSNFIIDIEGTNFLIYKMTKKEMLIKGDVNNVRFIK